MEYRGAFLSQVIAMFLNNSVWVIFWVIFFNRFPVLRGWEIKDVITLWAIAASGFGIADTICGNGLEIPRLITRGQLDIWMLYPRKLLPHMLLGRMDATACGDALFGYVVYIGFVHPDILHFIMFVALTLAVALVFIGFDILSGSLGFFIGNSEALTLELRFAMITFSTYPLNLFDGAVKIILYTLIPAGFVSYLPIQALRNLSLTDAFLTLLGGIGVILVGSTIFHLGLKRYESGNLLEMRN
jgi:ABC-2 type transport system permease protein